MHGLVPPRVVSPWPVLKSLPSRGNDECRVASLMPLLEESNGIYQFQVSMLRALHSGKPVLCSLAQRVRSC